MKYYIVATFDKYSYENILPLQKNIAKKYRTTRNSTIPFIPFALLENPNLEKLSSVIHDVISPYKVFRASVTPDLSMHEISKSVTLELINKGYVKRLSRILIDTLSINNFSVKHINDSYLYLGSLPYIAKEYKNQTIRIKYPNLYDENNIMQLSVRSIEVWKLPLNKRNQPICSFLLKTV